MSTTHAATAITPRSEEAPQMQWSPRPDTLLAALHFRNAEGTDVPSRPGIPGVREATSKEPPENKIPNEFYNEIKKHFPELLHETFRSFRERLKTGEQPVTSRLEEAVIHSSGYPDILWSLEKALKKSPSNTEGGGAEISSLPQHYSGLKNLVLRALEPIVYGLARFDDFMISTPYKKFGNVVLAGLGLLGGGAAVIVSGKILGGSAQASIQSLGVLMYAAGVLPFVLGPQALYLSWREKSDFTSSFRRHLERDPLALEELKAWLKEKNH